MTGDYGWMRDIGGYSGFAKAEPMSKGLSADRKYSIETEAGARLLLRVSARTEYDARKAQLDRMRRAAAAGVPMPEPVGFGVCDGGESAYTLVTWCDGGDALAELPLLTETEQHVLGVTAGGILRKIHSVPAPDTLGGWAARYSTVLEPRLEAYRNCGVRVDGDTYILRYLEENRFLLDNRPQCFLHGDFHLGNLVLGDDGALSVIDWEVADFSNLGDPWADFRAISNSVEISPAFAAGQIRGYFGGEPPAEFWRLLAYYLSAGAITAVAWSLRRGREMTDEILKLNKSVLTWFDAMRSPVPAWYQENIALQWLDGVPYRLREPFNMSFMSRYGRVFKVFDGQDSGNICFGVEEGGRRYFVKYAGAPTLSYSGMAGDAVTRLKAAVPVYRDLEHPNLVKLVRSEAVGGGFAAVFEWSDRTCVGRMSPLTHRRFMQLPPETRLGVFDDILAFHAHVAELGYAAIDFYDGSIMYDFNSGKTVICDVDFYAKRPYMNTMGRLWGSSRFMSPEEFELGAPIDEVTNVYTMGATAFALLSYGNRTAERWPLGAALYHTALKAVSGTRSDRQQSIRQFIDEWNKAKAEPNEHKD